MNTADKREKVDHNYDLPDLKQMSFNIRTPSEIKKTFTTADLSRIFGIPTHSITSYAFYLKLEPKKIRIHGANFNVYSFSDYIYLKAYLEGRKEKKLIEEINLPDHPADSVSSEHPLVTDKRFLKTSFFPSESEIVPSCFQDCEERVKVYEC